MTRPRFTRRTPAELFGPLLAAVQERGILNDGKTFVDAEPRRPVEAILADFAQFEGDDDKLLDFVEANFELPPAPAEATPGCPTAPLRDHIRQIWPTLARGPRQGSLNSSVLTVDHRHVVPGGRFREIYYWDSFFTMLGLIRDGHSALAEGIVEAMTDLIEEHGHVPNGARTYFVGRSQPPLFHMMVALLNDLRPTVAARRLDAMRREHGWWMAGEGDLAPGAQNNRVVMLADGSVLNRYWDPRDTPRDESWREDVETAIRANRPPSEVYRELRAGAESGWDFSSRWLEGATLGSIRTTTIVPIDLNAFLYGLERAIASAGGADAPAFDARADVRRAAIQRHLWNEQQGAFCDFDLVRNAVRPQLTAAAFAPLLSGVATSQQADATASVAAEQLLAPGGIRTTLVESGEQWDCPNGWAPLQWIAVHGLRGYGHHTLARTIAERWIATVESAYARAGLLYEKYDVERQTAGAGGEYSPQTGFGWTNGVTADLIDGLAAGF